MEKITAVFIVFAAVCFLQVHEARATSEVGFSTTSIDESTFQLNVWIMSTDGSKLVGDGTYIFSVLDTEAVPGIISWTVADQFLNAYSLSTQYDLMTGQVTVIMDKGSGPPVSIPANADEVIFSIIFSRTSDFGDFAWDSVTMPFPGGGAPDTAEDAVDMPLTDNPLPVLLTYIKAAQAKHSFAVEIEWETASEKNNDFFEVERSFDGASFEMIGSVSGKGTTDERSQYEYVDERPRLSGLVYYRLRQIDFDGEEELFPSVAVTIVPEDPFVMRYDGMGRLSVYAEIAGTFQLLTMDGIALHEMIVNGQEFDILGLKPGAYVAQLMSDEGQRSIKKIFVQ